MLVGKADDVSVLTVVIICLLWNWILKETWSMTTILALNLIMANGIFLNHLTMRETGKMRGLHGLSLVLSLRFHSHWTKRKIQLMHICRTWAHVGVTRKTWFVQFLSRLKKVNYMKLSLSKSEMVRLNINVFFSIFDNFMQGSYQVTNFYWIYIMWDLR